MGQIRGLIAAIVSVGLLGAPCWAAPTSQLGIVVFADHARVGTGAVSVGSTVFGGDSISTDATGSLQIRAGAARLLLANASAATLTSEDVSAGARLTTGTATFSTANAKAFTLHFRNASIRANTDEPTVGQVSVLGAKEIVVRSTRGALAVTVAGETRVIAEGTAYRIILDPTPAETAAAGAPAAGRSSGKSGPPVSAGTSKFVWYAVGVTALVTFFAVQESMESPDRP